MQRRTVKILLALLIVASLFLVLIPPATSMNAQGMTGKLDKMKNVDEVYETIAYVGTSNGVTTVNILNAAIKDKSGNVTMLNFTKPVSVQFYSANNTAVVGPGNKTWNRTGNRTGMHRPKMDYNSAAINPAGGSGIVALKNITVLSADNQTAVFQIGGIAVYLPDGTVKPYTFATPVKVTKSWKDRTTKIDNPAVIADLQDAFKGGAKFPANAAPVPLKKIDGK